MPTVKDVGEPCEENLMHGSMGGGRKPTPIGNAARRQAPPAYPTVTWCCSSSFTG
jgi:hypothetical protein